MLTDRSQALRGDWNAVNASARKTHVWIPSSLWSSTDIVTTVIISRMDRRKVVFFLLFWATRTTDVDVLCDCCTILPCLVLTGTGPVPPREPVFSVFYTKLYLTVQFIVPITRKTIKFFLNFYRFYFLFQSFSRYNHLKTRVFPLKMSSRRLFKISLCTLQLVRIAVALQSNNEHNLSYLYLLNRQQTHHRQCCASNLCIRYTAVAGRWRKCVISRI